MTSEHFVSLKKSLIYFNKIFNEHMSYSYLTDYLRKNKVKVLNRYPNYKFTNKMRQYLLENHSEQTTTQLTENINKLFKTNFTKQYISTKLCSLKLRAKNSDYTQEQIKWLKENSDKYFYKDLTILYNKTFDENRTKIAIESICKKRGFGNKKNVLCGFDNTRSKPIGYIGVQKRSDTNSYRYKYKSQLDSGKAIWISIPEYIAKNNKLEKNCAEAFFQIKYTDKILKECEE